jgi:hypothetical protein
MSSQAETWIWVKNGRVCFHIENDGYAFLRKGPEARDYAIVRESDSGLYYEGLALSPDLVDEAGAAIAKLAKEQENG